MYNFGPWALVNNSTEYTNDQITQWATDTLHHVQYNFAPIWHRTIGSFSWYDSVSDVPSPMPYVQYTDETPPFEGVSSQHGFTGNQLWLQVYASVGFPDFSHDFLSMLLDPFGVRPYYALNPQGTHVVHYLMEPCDPVGFNGLVGSTNVADFVLPAWWGAVPGTQYSFFNNAPGVRILSQGGASDALISWYDPTNGDLFQQFYGNAPTNFGPADPPW